MEKPKTTSRSCAGSQGGRGFLNRHRTFLLGICLVFGTITSASCAVAPSLVLTSAAVSAVAVITEGERLIQDVNEPNSVVVKNDTDVYTGPGEDYAVLTEQREQVTKTP